MGFGKSRAKMLTEKQGNVTFDDVAGIDEAHSAALTAALHPVHEIDPHPNEKHDRQERQEDRLEH